VNKVKEIRELEELVENLMSWQGYRREYGQKAMLEYDLAFHSKVLYYLQVGKAVVKAKLKDYRDSHKEFIKGDKNGK
jgi:hypothetical protein